MPVVQNADQCGQKASSVWLVFPGVLVVPDSISNHKCGHCCFVTLIALIVNYIYRLQFLFK